MLPSRPNLSHCYPGAFSASAPWMVFPWPRIRLRKLMPALAVRFLCIDGNDAYPTSDIDAMGNSFQVGRVDARSITTEMIPFESPCGSSYQERVGCYPPPVDLNPTVAILEKIAHPDPTVIGTARIGARPESQDVVATNVGWLSGSSIASFVPAVVVELAPATAYGPSLAAIDRASGNLGLHRGLILSGVMRTAVNAARPLHFTRLKETAGATS